MPANPLHLTFSRALLTTLTTFTLLTSAAQLCAQATTNPDTAAAPPVTPALAPAPTPTSPVATNPRSVRAGWWTSAVFYQVFVRSFSDSRTGPLAADGIGDLQGLIDHLDYIQSLGCDALWLLPITAAPSYHGYDTTDYFTIEPKYGTNADFKRLIDECHNRGIKVVVDFVLNHHSDQHKWFQRAIDPQSPWHDWYIWADTDPNYLGPWKEKVWHRVKGSAPATPLYYGIFSGNMPDLNYRNPEVSAQMLEVTRFWLEDMHVDGFRLDAVRHLVEDGQVQENTPGTHAWLNLFGDFVRARSFNHAFTVGEVWADAKSTATYIGPELDSCFAFDLAAGILDAVKPSPAATDKSKPAPDRAKKLAARINELLSGFPRGSASIFLTNHDIPRVMTILKGDAHAARLAALIEFSLPGIPFIYYGEELGMSGDKPDENIRTPMQWTSDLKNAGFTSADKPWRAPNPDTATLNVADQEHEPASMLGFYQQLVSLRRQRVDLSAGETRVLDSGVPGLLIILRGGVKDIRTIPGGRPLLLALYNLTDSPITCPPIELTQTLQEWKYPARSAAAKILLSSRAATVWSILPTFDNQTWRPVETIPAKTGVWIDIKPN
ncbi:alpha-amylase family glycosyl hydrolase [soil metagenome]